MNIRSVFHLISYMVMFIALSVVLTAGVSFAYRDPRHISLGLLQSAGIILGIGVLLWFATGRRKVDLSRKDGFAIVTLGWLVVGHVGAIPYMMTGVIASPIDAYFETISGFTTTGASILSVIDTLPKGILFWRSLTQWIGGMGVLLLCVAILPFLGVGGMQIYRAEMPGPSKDRLTPRIANTAKLLYGVYVLLTALQTIALKIAGMTWFDAICHSFCTLSTGGFSTHIASVAYFDSPTITLIITLFMIMGGINFALHFRLLKRDWLSYFRSPECNTYLILIGICSIVIAMSIYGVHYDTVVDSLIHSTFQVASIITGTGFATADYDTWPLPDKTVLLLLMFSGGCAGSTSGGVKVMRSLVALKACFREVRIFMQPQAVIKVKMGKQSVPHAVVASIASFFICFFLILVIATMIMTFYVSDLQTAASAALACLANVGPGFGAVGPAINYADIADPGKILLSFCMLLGRLELFTVLILFYPAFWKR